MTDFIVHVIEIGKPNGGFRHCFQAQDYADALAQTWPKMVEAYEESKCKEPREVVFVFLLANFDVPPKAWKLNLPSKVLVECEVPCGTCSGHGGVDSGGVDPQGKGIDIPCPSCQEKHEHANFSQPVCAVCATAHDLKDLVGTCPQCRESKKVINDWCKGIDLGAIRSGCTCDCPECKEGAEAKIVLNAWQEAFGTNQLTHALAENKEYGKALTNFQNEVWASLNRYSDTLGWGLSGMQPECWTCLDSAIEELKKRRQSDEQVIRILNTLHTACINGESGMTRGDKDALERILESKSVRCTGNSTVEELVAEELVAKRKLVEDIRKVVGLPDRCTDQMIVDAVQLTKDLYASSQNPRA